jgi:hypothetical protein
MIEELAASSVSSAKFIVPSASRLTFRPVRPDAYNPSEVLLNITIGIGQQCPTNFFILVVLSLASHSPGSA